MKFKLGNTRQYIEVEMVYTITRTSDETEFFLCTSEILEEYQITPSKFIKFLKQELSQDDPSYSPAFELWVSNKGIYTKTALKDLAKADIDCVQNIITAAGVINLQKKN